VKTPVTKAAVDMDLAKKLWEETEKQLLALENQWCAYSNASPRIQQQDRKAAPHVREEVICVFNCIHVFNDKTETGLPALKNKWYACSMTSRYSATSETDMDGCVQAIVNLTIACGRTPSGKS
jgi:hypothetical protein